MLILDIVLSLFVLVAAFLALVTARALLEAPDGITRANLLGPLTCVAIPLLILAVLIHDCTTGGFSPNTFLRALLAILCMVLIPSVSSFYLGRSLFGVYVSDAVSRPEEEEDSA